MYYFIKRLKNIIFKKRSSNIKQCKSQSWPKSGWWLIYIRYFLSGLLIECNWFAPSLPILTVFFTNLQICRLSQFTNFSTQIVFCYKFPAKAIKEAPELEACVGGPIFFPSFRNNIPLKYLSALLSIHHIKS